MYSSDVNGVDALAQAAKDLRSEIGKVIYGQEEVVKAVLISLFSNGHSLLVGVPGLAKTLLISTIAEVLDLEFKRIQFTPDLMPSDITGTEILDESRQFKFNKGPLFANIVLADEINRTPPKTQSALLEAMQEPGFILPAKAPIIILHFCYLILCCAHVKSLSIVMLLQLILFPAVLFLAILHQNLSILYLRHQLLQFFPAQ